MAVINGTPGNDALVGSLEDDTIWGGKGSDRLDGGAGNDQLNGGQGQDTLMGGIGADSLQGDLYLDRDQLTDFTLVDPNDPDSDWLGLSPQGFSLNQQGADLLHGGVGSDILIGGAGKDTLYGGDGDDLLQGGYRQIEAVYAGADSGILAVQYSQNGFGDDILHGGSGNDTLRGDSPQVDIVSDFLVGFYGDDQLFGDAGDDLLEGGTGTDTLYGGIGNDSLFGNYRDPVSTRGFEFFYSNSLFGGAGDDSLEGGSTGDLLVGGVGDDNLVGDQLGFVAGGDDTLNGGNGNDVLAGELGSDRLNGDGGNDTLLGYSPDLVTWNGHDEAIDTLTGGLGSDRFVLGGLDFYGESVVLYGANVRNLRAGNYAIITDFNPRVDSIQLVSTDFGDIFPEGNTVSYVLDQSPMGLPRGTGIFIDTDSNGTGDLLVAVISNNTDLNLNSSYFSFI